jgi:hypothetical protein
VQTCASDCPAARHRHRRPSRNPSPSWCGTHPTVARIRKLAPPLSSFSSLPLALFPYEETTERRYYRRAVGTRRTCTKPPTTPSPSSASPPPRPSPCTIIPAWFARDLPSAPDTPHLPGFRHTAMQKLRIVTLRDSGWELAHAAVSRRPPISLHTSVARTEHVHVRRGSLGFVHRSRTIFYRAVPKP